MTASQGLTLSRANALVISLLVALVLAVLSWWGYQNLKAQEQREYQADLATRSENHLRVVESTFGNLSQFLTSLAAYIGQTPTLSRAQFASFISAHALADYGIAQFEWIPRVAPSERQAVTALAKSQGLFDFALRHPPAPDFAAYYPVLYSYTTDFMGSPTGMDLATKPAFRQALAQALAQKQLVLHRIAANGSEAEEYRLLLAVKSPSGQVLGLVSSHFLPAAVIDVLIGGKVKQSSLCLRITTPGGQTLYQSRYNQLQQPCVYQGEMGQRWSRTLKLGQQPLRFSFYEQQRQGSGWWSRANIALSAALLVAGLLGMLLYSSLRYTQRIRHLVQLRTRSLISAENEYHNLFMQAVDGIYRADLQGRLLRYNPAFALTFGFSDMETLAEQVQHLGAQLHRDPTRYANFLLSLRQQGKVSQFEWQAHTHDGRSIWLLENAYLCQNAEGQSYYEGSISVITERKQTELLLKHQAEHDALTGLINRATFIQQLEGYLSSAHLTGKLGAVLFMDLDRFKLVNDTLGHPVGDELLTLFAGRLRACLREQDLVARFGGDEFAVLLQQQDSSERVQQLARRIVQAAEQPFRFSSGQLFKASVSIGIDLISQKGQSANQILSNADAALYEVKRKGRGHFVLFNQHMSLQLQRRNRLALALDSALEQDQFELHYQPIMDLAGLQLLGFEALLRWQHPQLGMVSPAEFVPICEETGLIEPLGRWVLRQAMAQAVRFIGLSANPRLFMNINLSPQQLLNPRLSDELQQGLREQGLLPHQLHLEITESAIHRHEEQVIAHLQQIRAKGIRIYIDDFGTGHSSLERLVTYPIQGLKIDRSFTNRIEHDTSKAVVVEATLLMAKLLELDVTAEGIETASQRECLLAMGCQQGQGYWLSRPLTQADAEGLCQPSLRQLTG
ncbi:bifunctional diguanylate cyclase/phosphodiesterase [Balneatrix alpica]|uniref:EAL domain-containing protein n=1 Tax=Balneatrix alpica TaxID=75684 RepID=A0ABV5ZA60_9GAMM|nr:EAL domain-containing protein [Balneatrix alpica]